MEELACECGQKMPEVFSIGDRLFFDSDTEYLLCKAGFNCGLVQVVNLDNGKILNDFSVKDIYSITREEFLKNVMPSLVCPKCKTKYVEPPKKTYKRGQIFIEKRNGDKYVLAMINSNRSMCLISINDGNRYMDPVIVDDAFAVTQKEFDKMTNFKEFVLVE